MKTAIVLAAGASRRMGRPKQSLPLRGSTMLECTLDAALAASFDEVRVVVPEGSSFALPTHPKLVRIDNPAASEGIASSLRAGLQRLSEKTETLAVLLADLPFVRTETLDRLLGAASREPERIVLPRYRGEPGHPVLFPRRLVPELLELRGDRGARSVLERHRGEVRAIDVDDPGVRLDIDTPRDYASEMSRERRPSVFRELEEAYERGEAVALVTILETRGSTPQKAGAKMVVGRDGRLRGTVGGGCVESEILWRAQRAIEKRSCEIGTYDFNADEEENGLICGGSMKVFIEPILPPPRVYIIGAGHVAQPVSQVAKVAGFEVVVLDDRVKYASPERFPEADVVRAGPIPELADAFQYGDNAFVVIVTRGHKEDEEALRVFVEKDAGYVGLIGSVNKIEKIFQRLERDGVSRERLDRVHSPIGLDLGGSTPGEIAVSIVAELLAIRYQRTGKSMRFTERQEYFGKV